MRQFLVVALLLLLPAAQAQNEPVVRIGLNQNAQTVTLRSANPFSVQQYKTRSATFTMALALGSATPTGALTRSDLQRRLIAELDGDVVLVMPPVAKARI